jgi:hypothetical protein
MRLPNKQRVLRSPPLPEATSDCAAGTQHEQIEVNPAALTIRGSPHAIVRHVRRPWRPGILGRAGRQSDGQSIPQSLCSQPEDSSGGGRVDPGPGPPRRFIAMAMDFAMVPPTKWDRKLIADLAAERGGLCKTR